MPTFSSLELADADITELDSAVVMAMETLEHLGDAVLLRIAQEDEFDARANAARILLNQRRAAADVLEMVQG